MDSTECLHSGGVLALKEPRRREIYSCNNVMYCVHGDVKTEMILFTMQSNDVDVMYVVLQSAGDGVDSWRTALSQNCAQPSSATAAAAAAAAVGWPYSPPNIGVYSCPAAA